MIPDFVRFRGDGKPPIGGQIVCRPGQRGHYLADAELVRAVNTALAVELPLLLTGEPGSGKSDLAYALATELGLGEVLVFSTRSDHRGQDLLYSFDHLGRLYDANRRDGKGVMDLESYVEYHALGQAIRSPKQRVVLIDEIDKAPRDFPNDLLNELDQMSFTVRETQRSFPAERSAPMRPVVVITSNSERQLPEAFLRRCVFHHLKLPNRERYLEILQERLQHLQVSPQLAEAAVDRYGQLRNLDLVKKPATAELMAWVQVLHRAGLAPEDLKHLDAVLEWPNALLKTQEDRALVARASPDDWERAAKRLREDRSWA